MGSIYVVIFNQYDDTEVIGATLDKERAKEMKREYVKAELAKEVAALVPNAYDKDVLFEHTYIFEVEDGVRSEFP